MGKTEKRNQREGKTSDKTAGYLHIEVVMSGVVSVEDKLLNQVTCRIEQDVLKNMNGTDKNTMFNPYPSRAPAFIAAFCSLISRRPSLCKCG